MAAVIQQQTELILELAKRLELTVNCLVPLAAHADAGGAHAAA